MVECKDIGKYFNKKSPGEYIQFFLDKLGWTQSTLAEITGISLRTINQIANNSAAISAENALLLAKAFSTDAAFWVKISAEYQILRQKEKLVSKEELAGLKAQFHKYMPVSDLVKKGWIGKNTSSLEGIKETYRYMFNSETLPEDFYEAQQGFCARRNREDEEFTKYYCKTWEIFARRYACEIQGLPEYKRSSLVDIAENLNEFTLLDNGEISVIEKLNSAGVGFFVLPHLQKTYLDGASFIESINEQKNPFIVYTARYDRNDNFWFAIAHEIAHVLLHLYDGETGVKKMFFDDLEESGERNPIETQADNYASSYLKKDRVMELSRVGSYMTKARLQAISREAGVCEAVALGMLQHEKKIPWRNFADMKQKVLWKIPEKYIFGMENMTKAKKA